MPPRRALGSETTLSGGTSGNAAGPRIPPVARPALPPAARNRGKLAREVAPALFGANIAFRDELGIGSLDRDDAHAKVAREGSLGGKLFIGQDVPVGDALLRRVWGFDYYGGSRTVDVHVRRVRAKLGPELAQRLETVRGVGYLWSA